MIDSKKGRNSFEKFPTLQEKCDRTVALAHRQQQQPTNYNFNNNTSVHKPRTITTAAALFPTTTKTRLHTTTNTISINGKAEAKFHNGGGRRAASVSSTRNTKISSNVKNNKNNNTNSEVHNSEDTNPVRVANKPFFLVPQFQDQNFLKEECELAHAQVAPKQQQQQQQQQTVATANGGASNNSGNNNNNSKASHQPSGNHRCNSGDSSKSNNNNNTSNSKNHSQKTNSAYSNIISIHPGISRRTATTTQATVAAVTANGVRRSGGDGGGSANASVNINQHHHNHVSTSTSAVATTSSNAAATAASVTAKNATTDTTVHKVDIVFNNRAQTQTNGGRFVTSKSAKQPQQHNTYNAMRRPLTGTTLLATTATGAQATSTTASIGGGTAAATVTKLSNGQSKLVRPLVHRTIPSTAVAAANAATARDNVNAYSNKLFNSYGSNSNRLSNNNNNNINNNGVNSVCNINNSGSSNNNITSNNTSGGSGVNGMQHTIDHDDIKYIDSDDAPTTVATAAAHASATTVITSSRGGAQLERKTQLRCEQLCCQHTNCATSTTATLTGAAGAAGGGGGGSGVSVSASLKARMRPKSTIICSTSNLVFEKINNYKYANGSVGGGSSAAKFVAEAAAARRNELRHSIDSNSIRASIEKFDSFSEQKRSAGVPQVTLRSHGGSGSANNLQHHRHSGSEFDHATGGSSLLRLAQSGGGSLTRAPYRTVSPSPATACKVTATMHAPSLTTCSTGSSSSIRSGVCSTNSLPMKCLGSVLAATTNATAVTAINRHQEISVLHAAERASPSALLHKDATSSPASSSSSPLLKQAEMKMPNGDLKKCANAETNGVCDGAIADVETMNIRRPCCCH